MVLDHGHEYGSHLSRDYHLKQLHDAENAIVEQQERDYEVLVAHWQPKMPAANGRRFIVVYTTALSSTGSSRDGTNSPRTVPGC
jgi:hypothetical protein